ncbi:MAG: thioredoxin family protein [Clostridia bacterium]|nr:thioredoxin family protein [Clostridia bacterium]
MEIKILGQGCSKCKSLYERTIQAKEDLNLDAEVIKVESIKDIVKYGVMRTPALVVENEVKVVGKVPTVDEIKTFLNK